MAEQEVQQQASHLCELMESRERERGQWVRELQHEMAQTLTGLRCHLTVIQRSSDEVAGQLVDELAHWLRDLAIRVRPPMLDDLGLGPTLTWYANRLEQQTGRSVQLRLQNLDERLPYLCETAGFRVVTALLPELLRGEHTQAVKLRAAVQDDALWLFVSWGGDVSPAAAGAVEAVREWVAWMEGTVRLDRAADTGHLAVMIPAA
jgi:signal transduction histidine kinase